MYKKTQGFMAGFLVATFLMGMVLTATAAGNETTVTAFLSNVKLKLNGQDWTPKDSVTGEYYKAISYNGRIYLPLRAVVEEAAKMSVDFDNATQTVWLGGKSDVLQIKESNYYEDYFGTIITTDSAKLATPGKAYQWGITNAKDIDMQYFTCYVKPNGKYQYFKTSFFMDESAKDKLTINIRKDTYNGEVIKSIDIKPGETVADINADIGGMNRICIESNVGINHGTIKKLVIGEPIFYNGALKEASPTQDSTTAR